MSEHSSVIPSPTAARKMSIPDIGPSLRKVLSRLELEMLARKKHRPDVNIQNGLQSYETSSAEDLVFDLFKVPDTEQISVDKFLSLLRREGLNPHLDPRLAEMMDNFRQFEDDKNSLRDVNIDICDSVRLYLTKEEFKSCVGPSKLLVIRALQNQLVIPDWKTFKGHIKDIYEDCRMVNDGKNADYIPQLARIDPNLWAVSVCTVDGQRASWGDAQVPFCFQSISKAFNYALALEAQGADEVHKWVGQEPSGNTFNDICLNRANKPHNPMINSGALVIASILQNKWKLSDRFDYVMNRFKAFAGNENIGFSNQTFLSERECADRNYALAYYMREKKCFPADSKLSETMDLYVQMCSMETTSESMAVMTATLANGGVCPLTNERVVSNRACRETLSLMHSCGMVVTAKEFRSFPREIAQCEKGVQDLRMNQVGLPAKSGVSGAVAVVIPNEMGICIYSPKLDQLGNSVKGITFFEELVERFNFHNYDSVLHAEDQKIDPRQRSTELAGEQVVYVLFAAKTGDIISLKQYVLRGMTLETQDYDGRTALHVAAAEGHVHVMKFLREVGKVHPQPKDRWERTPLDDARFFKQEDAVEFLTDWLTDVGLLSNEKTSLDGPADRHSPKSTS